MQRVYVRMYFYTVWSKFVSKVMVFKEKILKCHERTYILELQHDEPFKIMDIENGL